MIDLKGRQTDGADAARNTVSFSQTVRRRFHGNGRGDVERGGEREKWRERGREGERGREREREREGEG